MKKSIRTPNQLYLQQLLKTIRQESSLGNKNSLFVGLSIVETGLGVKKNLTAGCCGGNWLTKNERRRWEGCEMP